MLFYSSPNIGLEQPALMTVDYQQQDLPPRWGGTMQSRRKSLKDRGSLRPVLDACEISHGLVWSECYGAKKKEDKQQEWRRPRLQRHSPNGGDQERALSVSSIAAETMRTAADRVAENTMAAADIVHEQTEQLVVDLCRQSDLMARQVENFFGRWVKLVTLPTQMTRKAAAKIEEARKEQRAA